MNRWLVLTVFAIGAVAASPASAASAPELALKRVVVSTGGVAYYEHEAVVEGDAELTLDVRLDQVDDVLKSLVVFDAQGGVGAVRLAGREPMAEVFRDLPFAEADLGSLSGLLASLKGVEIEVAGPQTTRGRVLSVVEEATRGEGGTETVRHRVSIAAADGIHQFVLEDAKGVRFVDAGLAAQVDGALAATARYRVADRRALAISMRGKAKRGVRVGYVVAAPIWKTAYRLTVTEGQAKGALQGWAVLENRSGHDWAGVELTLVSGNPVTFRQALYESYYVDRPEVPVDVAGHVLPGVDTGAMNKSATAARAADFSLAPPSPSRMMRSLMPEAMAESAPMGAGFPEPAPPPAAAAERAEASEAATQVLFRMPGPVSVAAGHSLAVPIVDRAVPASRVDLFDSKTHRLHPLAAVRLVNDGGVSLPAGVLTVYERATGSGAVAFVGDARVGLLPAGEERFASFALDAKVRVDRSGNDERTVRRTSVAKGVLRIVSLLRSTTDYRFAGASAPIVIEHPRRDGWRLAAPDAATVKETPRGYRVTATPAADGSGVVTVVLERTTEETVGLLTVSSDQFLGFSKDGALSEAARTAFAEAAKLKRAVEDLERAIDELRVEREAIVEDQERVRENLGAAPEGSDLQDRYQKKLAAQEDRLEANEREAAGLKEGHAKARDVLAAYIEGLDF